MPRRRATSSKTVDLTINELKSVISQAGFSGKLPSTRAKKSVYVEIYREFVLPNEVGAKSTSSVGQAAASPSWKRRRKTLTGKNLLTYEPSNSSEESMVEDSEESSEEEVKPKRRYSQKRSAANTDALRSSKRRAITQTRKRSAEREPSPKPAKRRSSRAVATKPKAKAEGCGGLRGILPHKPRTASLACSSPPHFSPIPVASGPPSRRASAYNPSPPVTRSRSNTRGKSLVTLLPLDPPQRVAPTHESIPSLRGSTMGSHLSSHAHTSPYVTPKRSVNPSTPKAPRTPVATFARTMAFDEPEPPASPVWEYLLLVVLVAVLACGAYLAMPFVQRAVFPVEVASEASLGDVATLRAAALQILGSLRGAHECDGISHEGLSKEMLKSELKNLQCVDSNKFDSAFKQVTDNPQGGLVLDADKFQAVVAIKPFRCFAIDWMSENAWALAGFAVVICIILYIRKQLRRRRLVKNEVTDMTYEAKKLIQKQQELYRENPGGTEPFLPISHVRDTLFYDNFERYMRFDGALPPELWNAVEEEIRRDQRVLIQDETVQGMRQTCWEWVSKVPTTPHTSKSGLAASPSGGASTPSSSIYPSLDALRS